MQEKHIHEQAIERVQKDNVSGDTSAGELMAHSFVDFQVAIQDALRGLSTRQFDVKQDVVFMLDNKKEVQLRVRKIRLQYHKDRVHSLEVDCRTDFENVLILAKKLKMKISAFSTYFTVHLSASQDFKEEFNDRILEMKTVDRFFETLDELKRPIFLNLNHYIVSRISD